MTGPRRLSRFPGFEPSKTVTDRRRQPPLETSRMKSLGIFLPSLSKSAKCELSSSGRPAFLHVRASVSRRCIGTFCDSVHRCPNGQLTNSCPWSFFGYRQTAAYPTLGRLPARTCAADNVAARIRTREDFRSDLVQPK